MQPHSPVESGFMPRKEFIRDQRTTNTFCLLAISGSSLIRLYSFPLPLIDSLRRLFDHFYLSVAFREDAAQNLCEFTLDAKPWASPKSVKTERILVDILAVIYKHGYSYVSTIDYGREHDDRLAIAFSRPSASPSPPHSMYPIPAGSGSNISHQTGPKIEKRVPFAISFVSAKILRVIYPPLHSTPAILQAVRASWPRGVVSEKKVGDASYEFKLKGYKWFQEDTFATDSLRHILSLLSSLDAHAFSLVASLSLSNRSRVKDLWIFTGAGSSDTSDMCWPESPIATMSHSGSYPELKTNPLSIPDPPVYTPEKGLPPSHRRMVTAPSAPYHDSQGPFGQAHTQHFLTRAPTEKVKPPALITTSGLSSPGPAGPLRKPAPRAQVPVSVDLDAAEDEDHDQFNADLPSTIPSAVENMTGIGTMARRRFSSNLVYTASPTVDDEVFEQQIIDGNDSRYPPFQNGNARARSPSFQRRLSAFRPASRLRMSLTQSTHNAIQSLDTSSIAPTRRSTTQDVPPPVDNQDTLLLSGGAFSADDIRDSTFSAQTDTNCEIPIKWTGGVKGMDGRRSSDKVQKESSPALHRTSTGPVFPGGWAGTPGERGPSPGFHKRPKHDDKSDMPGNGMANLSLERDRYTNRSLQDVDARVASPEVVTDPEEAMRRSEAGLIGMMSPPTPPVSPSRANFDRPKAAGTNEPPPPRSPTKGASGCSTGTGWVLVNVETRANPDDHGHSRTHSPSPIPSSNLHTANGRSPKNPTQTGHASSMSAAAKAIVVIDAKDSKSPKGKGKSPSGLRGLLSLSRTAKNADEPRHRADHSRPRSTEPLSNGGGRQEEKTQPGKIRNKLMRMGVSEASPRRADEKRLTLD